jgi:hypothetical protein
LPLVSKAAKSYKIYLKRISKTLINVTDGIDGAVDGVDGIDNNNRIKMS